MLFPGIGSVQNPVITGVHPEVFNQLQNSFQNFQEYTAVEDAANGFVTLAFAGSPVHIDAWNAFVEAILHLQFERRDFHPMNLNII
jgi:hypothetical protein